MRGIWRGGSFTGDLEGYVKEGSVNGHVSMMSPFWGTWVDAPFLGL